MQQRIGGLNLIATVTFNPSLDYTVTLGEFLPGTVNRTKSERITPGGKGINVSLVLRQLGEETAAYGFLAGFTGKEIESRLKEAGCRTEFIGLKEGNSRINVKIRAREESEINGQGPRISREALEALYRKLERLDRQDMLVLAGSIPSGLSDTVYRDIAERMHEKGVPVTVDATGKLLLSVLEFRPFLIKPNHHELAELFGTAYHKESELVRDACRLREMGAQNVLVSMAAEGAVLAAADGNVYRCAAPGGTAVDSVGAGDSMVAGFLAGFHRSGSFREALRTGIAAGSASAFKEGLAEKQDVEAVLERMEASVHTAEQRRGGDGG